MMTCRVGVGWGWGLNRNKRHVGKVGVGLGSETESMGRKEGYFIKMSFSHTNTFYVHFILPCSSDKADRFCPV